MSGAVCAHEECDNHATKKIHGVMIEGERFTVPICDEHTGEAIRERRGVNA